MPTEVSEKDFKEFLDLNKIIYAKAERLTSKKDGRVLQMFKLEIKDEAEAEALISQNLTCHTAGIIYRVEEFRSQFRYSSAGIVKVSAIRQKRVGPKPNVLSVERATITKDALTERKSSQNAPTVKGHMLLFTKGVQHTKNKHLDNMWWTIKSHMLPSYAKTRLPLSPRIRHSHF